MPSGKRDLIMAKATFHCSLQPKRCLLAYHITYNNALFIEDLQVLICLVVVRCDDFLCVTEIVRKFHSSSVTNGLNIVENKP